jgi:hypothetical protein
MVVKAEHEDSVGQECDLECEPEKDPEWLVLLQHSTVVVKFPSAGEQNTYIIYWKESAQFDIQEKSRNIP